MAVSLYSCTILSAVCGLFFWINERPVSNGIFAITHNMYLILRFEFLCFFHFLDRTGGLNLTEYGFSNVRSFFLGKNLGQVPAWLV